MDPTKSSKLTRFGKYTIHLGLILTPETGGGGLTMATARTDWERRAEIMSSGLPWSILLLAALLAANILVAGARAPV